MCLDAKLLYKNSQECIMISQTGGKGSEKGRWTAKGMTQKKFKGLSRKAERKNKGKRET